MQQPTEGSAEPVGEASELETVLEAAGAEDTTDAAGEEAYDDAGDLTYEPTDAGDLTYEPTDAAELEPAAEDATELATAEPEPAVAVAVTDLGLAVRGRTIYQDVSFTAAAGSLVIVNGPSGSGRTTLLLALAGRMKPTTGHLEVLGHELPRESSTVQRSVALAEMHGVNPLEPALSIHDHVRERISGLSPWYKPMIPARRYQAARTLLEDLAGSVGISASDEATLVRDLHPLERSTVGIGLALLAEPRILVVDNVDSILDAGQRTALWELLRQICADGSTVVASCVELPLPEILDDDRCVRVDLTTTEHI
ncbi:ATP-binding cassette domain-containing protein [Saxibacter everestensis]|uniref:ATP-binding cassette domain-containing protein n=1 Tax=Saxibacter everestensis TaxID=2909229 RepID=A0ABY8QXW5_9MICO|nr:ATP-binding cassette domain-containing protein [Brevibacteriaceae bacterium ZFBP1038]